MGTLAKKRGERTSRLARTLAAALAGVAPAMVGGSVSANDGTVDSGTPLAAEQIFERARDAWSAEIVPESTTYAISVTALANGRSRIDERYRGVMGRSADDYHVERFSVAELDAPARPHGFNVFVSVLGSNVIQLNHDVPKTNILGSPQLSARYSFGLERSFAPNASRAESLPSDLRVIGSVRAKEDRYAIVLIGRETLDGRDVFHLVLRPLRDPHVWRLRELWVDCGDYSLLRAITDGNFTDGPSLGVRWLVTFAKAAGTTYIRSERALGPLRFARHLTYESVVVSFEDLSPSTRHAPPFGTVRFDAAEDLREP